MSTIAFLAFAWNLYKWLEGQQDPYDYKFDDRANGWWAFFWLVVMIVSY